MATKELKEPKELATVKTQDAALSNNMTVDALLLQRALVKEAMQKVMTRDVDFGRIGGGEKDSLLQPGAQKLCMVFRLAPLFESKEIIEGNHLTIKATCTIKHSPTGMILGSGEGLCTTKEKKYARRKENGRIVDNLNLPDLYNTVLKMANKRALVAAVLNVTAAGDIFTQDMVEEPLVVEDKDEPQKVDAVVKDTPQPEAEKETKKLNGIPWRGELVKVDALELPGGRPAWAIHAFDGLEFKTTDSTFADFACSLIREKREAIIKHHKNGNGTNVIDSLVPAEEAA